VYKCLYLELVSHVDVCVSVTAVSPQCDVITGRSPLRVGDVTVLSCWSRYSGIYPPALEWYRFTSHITSQDLYDIALARRDIRVLKLCVLLPWLPVINNRHLSSISLLHRLMKLEVSVTDLIVISSRIQRSRSHTWHGIGDTYRVGDRGYELCLSVCFSYK